MSRWLPLRRVVRKIVAAAGARINFLSQTGLGLRVRTRLRAIAARATVGVGIVRYVADLRTRQTIGVGISRARRTGTHAKESADLGLELDGGLHPGSRAVASHEQGAGFEIARPGLQSGSRSVSGQLAEFGFEVVEHYVRGTNRLHVDTASESAASDWENIAESEGAPDSTNATLSSGLVVVQGSLFGTFPAQRNRGSAAIDSVKVRCYYRLANFIAGSSLTIDYSTTFDDAVPIWHNMRTIIGGLVENENHLSSGEEFDITADGPDGAGGAWTWADLSDTAFAVRYNGTLAVQTGLTGTIVVDATRRDIDLSSVEAG